jgi:cytochrome c oxidase subunit 2
VIAASAALLCGAAAQANPEAGQLNMPRGASEWSAVPYFLNNLALGVCVAIGVLVFGAMAIAMFRFRKSRGAVAEQWTHNTRLEIVWTTIPVIILAVLAYLATDGLTSFANTTGSQMTVKVTGYQWKWRYDYIDYMGKPIEKVGFLSKLDRRSDDTRQLRSGMNPAAVTVDGYNTYLIDVDRPLVVPVGVKIRFVITADDVIHSWWVPQLGWKMDAIPGMINSAWTKIPAPGVFRGQCAELCGQDHAFMPIVVKAVPQAEFEQWLAAQQSPPAVAPAANAATAAATAAITTPAPVPAPIAALGG